MSFGYSIGDGILLAQLAWKTLQGARKACGEHDELTREVASLHRVLQRLQKELANPDSLVNRVDDDRRRELNDHGEGCETVLNVMNSIVTKYNKLSNTERSGKRIWQKIKFGNGEMKDLADIRLKLSAHTSAITMSLNLCSLGSQGRVEKQLSDMGGDLHGIRGKVNWIAANMTARSGDGTVWTSYENDDKSFWRQLRRELVREGYRSSVLHKHKGLLKDYVEELGRRGAFDQVDSEKSEDEDEVEDGGSQESMEPEDDCSAVTESEGSDPEDSDLDPLLLNDNSDQLEEIAGPDPLPSASSLQNQRVAAIIQSTGHSISFSALTNRFNPAPSPHQFYASFAPSSTTALPQQHPTRPQVPLFSQSTGNVPQTPNMAMQGNSLYALSPPRPVTHTSQIWTSLTNSLRSRVEPRRKTHRSTQRTPLHWSLKPLPMNRRCPILHLFNY
jgi:hypothetical protein